MSRCIDCKWAYLDAQERLTIKLLNEPEIFECLQRHNEPNINRCTTYDKVLLDTHHCEGYEPCP